MRFMIRGRATGKTHELMHWLADHPNGVVVAHNQMEADRLFDLARIDHGLEVTSDQFLSVNLALKGALRGGRSVPVAVDNADLILRLLLGNVDIVTATGELYDEERWRPGREVLHPWRGDRRDGSLGPVEEGR